MIIEGKNWFIKQPSQKELDNLYNSSFYHVETEKECIICKCKFKYGRSNNHNCKLHKLYVKCPICNKIHELNFDSLSGTQLAEIIEKIHKNEEIFNCCSLQCRNQLVINNQKKNKTGWFSKEAIIKKNSSKNNAIRYQNALKRGNNLRIHKCQNKNCQNYNIEIKDNCPDNMWFCKKCYWKPENSILGSLPNFITKNNVRYYKDKELNKLCEDILSGKEDISQYPGFEIRYYKICYNGIDVLNGNFKSLVGNFHIENGVKYYKNQNLKELCKKILNNEININNFPGFEIRFGRVTYNRRDILTDENILLKGNNFIVKDNVEFILNHSTGKYEEKDEFYRKYNDYINSLNIDEEIQKFINLGFNLEPIIKINNDNWNREQTDKMLVEKGYGWICYIKLFKNIPFIVGKTGTRLVSNSPIDFDFKVYNEKDLNDIDYNGQGRCFIRQCYPDVKYTDFDKILIKNFNTEQETYDFENFCSMKFNLYNS